MTKQIIHVTKDSGIPLLGAIAFGIIDRGTNLLQIRPTSICNLNCPFCSTDSGPCSKIHQADYIVDLDYLIEWTKEVVEVKIKAGCEKIECNIDSVGEIGTYPQLIELVKRLKNIDGVYFVSMQTNGLLLTKDIIDGLEKAGLDRINLSIHSLDDKKSKELAGVDFYNIQHLKELSGYISKRKIELFITPVWIPKINNQDIVEIIKYAKSINANLGIQKYETYRYSRKINKSKEITYWKFYKQLKDWEKEFDIRLKLTREIMNIHKCKKIPMVFEKGDKVSVKIICPGWVKNQMIGVASNRCISINDCHANIGDTVKVKIKETKNSLYIADIL